MWKLLRGDSEVNACWDDANFIAVARLGYNDHEEVHAKVVAANALETLGLLDAGVLPDVMEERAGGEDDACLAVLLPPATLNLPSNPHPERAPIPGVRGR